MLSSKSAFIIDKHQLAQFLCLKLLIFLTFFSLSNKSPYLANKISYRKISEIHVKAAKFKILRLSFPLLWKTANDICIVKEFWSKSRFCWEMRNGSRKVLDFLRLSRSFHVHFTSFSVWNLAFLRNWAFHFSSMWILTTTAFQNVLHLSPKRWR
jgi:hypothetical protein